MPLSMQLMPSSGGLGGVVGGGCHKPRPGLGLVGGWVATPIQGIFRNIEIFRSLFNSMALICELMAIIS